MKKIVLFTLVSLLLMSCSSEGEMSVKVESDRGFVITDTLYGWNDNLEKDSSDVHYLHDYVQGYTVTVSAHSYVLDDNLSVSGFVQTEEELKEKTCELKSILKTKLDNINKIEEIEKDLESIDCS